MSYNYSPPSYQEGLNFVGIEVLEWVTFGQWQGDYAAILKEEDDFGFVVIGYGSCSGCDALYGCESSKEYLDLLQRVVGNIKWGSKEDLLAEINNEYDDNNWYRHDNDFDENKSKLIEAIKGEQ